MRCSRCGNANESDFVECWQCGATATGSLSQRVIGSIKPRKLSRLLPFALLALVGLLASAGGGTVAFARWKSPERPVKRTTVGLPKIQTDEQLAARAGASVLRLDAVGCGRSLSGSAFVVAPHIVITNWHLVAVDATPTLRLRTGEVVESKVLGASIARDVAVLETKRALQPVLSWADQRELTKGSHLFSLGFSEKTAGIVGTSNTIAEFVDVDFGRNAIRMSTPVERGSSGGPALTNRGRVAGLMTTSGSGGTVAVLLPNYLVASAIESAVTRRPGFVADCSVSAAAPVLTAETVPSTTSTIYEPLPIPTIPPPPDDYPAFPETPYYEPPPTEQEPTVVPPGSSFDDGGGFGTDGPSFSDNGESFSFGFSF